MSSCLFDMRSRDCNLPLPLWERNQGPAVERAITLYALPHFGGFVPPISYVVTIWAKTGRAGTFWAIRGYLGSSFTSSSILTAAMRRDATRAQRFVLEWRDGFEATCPELATNSEVPSASTRGQPLPVAGKFVRVMIISLLPRMLSRHFPGVERSVCSCGDGSRFSARGLSCESYSVVRWLP
jgi:hypothetical protein